MLLAFLLSFTALSQNQIAGTASVVDGDTIEIHGERIRLSGIDAPESGQSCQYADGASYRCGQQAALFLSDMIGRSTVRCDIEGEDRYNRLIGVCNSRGQNLNAIMVRSGHALAYREYSLSYVADETEAQRAAIGIWQGAFVEPWRWRRGERLPRPAALPIQVNANSADRDCRDFRTQREAQAFFDQAGQGDPHRLDADGDGIACESLPN